MFCGGKYFRYSLLGGVLAGSCCFCFSSNMSGWFSWNKLSSSIHKGPGSPEHVTQAALCWMFGCFGFLDNKLVAWEAWPGLYHHEGWQEPAGGSSRCLERKEMRGKLRVLGNVPTQCKREAWGRGHIRKGRAKWFWEGCSWVLPQGEKVLFQCSFLLERTSLSSACACCLPPWASTVVESPSCCLGSCPVGPWEQQKGRCCLMFNAVCKRGASQTVSAFLPYAWTSWEACSILIPFLAMTRGSAVTWGFLPPIQGQQLLPLHKSQVHGLPLPWMQKISPAFYNREVTWSCVCSIQWVNNKIAARGF